MSLSIFRFYFNYKPTAVDSATVWVEEELDATSSSGARDVEGLGEK
jgi:hypothetical protein